MDAGRPTGRPTVLRTELSDLVHRYAALADQRRVGDLADLFSPDGVLVLPAAPERLDAHLEVRTPPAIAAHLQVLDELTLTVHEIVGEVYDPAGSDRATGRIACVAHHLADGQDVVWHLHYNDDYVRHQAGWRIARRELHIDFISTLRVARHR